MENTTVEIKKVDYFELDKIFMRNLTANEERVYRNLLSHKNNNQDYAFPSQELIAKESNVSISTVKRAIKSLVNKGFIAIEKMKRIIGHYNKYKLLYVASMDVVRDKIKAKKESTNSNETAIKISKDVVSIEEYKENKESNVNKILEFTKIEKITDKQKESIKEFDIVTINQTIARIKTGITKMPRTATLLIDKICDTAVGLGKLKDWQYKKYNLLKPVDHDEAIIEELTIEENNDLEELLLGWD
ncbi:MAG: helix-turn-helix domain-containing protein [Sarcina sp.]